MAVRTHEEFHDYSFTSQIFSKKSSLRISAVLDYLLKKRGPLASTGCDHGAFISTTGACGWGGCAGKQRGRLRTGAAVTAMHMHPDTHAH